MDKCEILYEVYVNQQLQVPLIRDLTFKKFKFYTSGNNNIIQYQAGKGKN